MDCESAVTVNGAGVIVNEPFTKLNTKLLGPTKEPREAVMA